MTTNEHESSRSEAETPDVTTPIRGRWRRRCKIAGVVVIVLLGLFWYAATSPLFVTPILESMLEERSGGNVHIDRASISIGGTLRVEGLHLQSKTIDGPAGDILQIESAEIELGRHPLFDQSIDINNVILDGVTLRLSEDEAQGGALNLATLNPSWGSEPSRASTLPPSIEIRSIVLENGSHNGSNYTYRGDRRLAGELHPGPDARATGWFYYSLGEIDEHGMGLKAGGLLLKGEWNLATNEHTTRMDDLELDGRARSLCPVIARRMWAEMDLAGHVREAKLTYRRGMPLSMTLEVENVELTIPIDAEGTWARYRDGAIESTPDAPRLRVTSGSIRLDSNELAFEGLRGEFGIGAAGSNVAPVPYELHMSVPISGGLDWENRAEWVEELLDTAPFELTFSMERFQVGPDAGTNATAVDLPKVVAEALERFRMTGWELRTFVRLTRDEPELLEDGTLVARTIQSEGTAFIDHARCTYDKFPYPMQDVSAQLEFTNQSVTVHQIVGHGARSGTFRLSGNISPLDLWPGIDLSLNASDIPFDDVLLDALPDETRNALDSLMHKPSYDALVDAGVFDNDARLNTLTTQRDRLRERLIALQQNDPDDNAELIHTLQTRLTRLQQSIDAGPFKPGGQVDLALNIKRDVGRGEPTYTTGRITIDKAGLILKTFPYPLQITRGALDWYPDRLEVVDGVDGYNGIQVLTPGGGIGLIKGTVGLREPGDTARPPAPTLQFVATGDVINPALLAALPPEKQNDEQPENIGWPGAERSAIADQIEQLGLVGMLDYEGSIFGDDDGLAYDISLNLTEGELKPQPAFLESINASGTAWPESLNLSDLDALLKLTRSSISLNEMTGTHNTGTATASGSLDTAASPNQLRFRVNLDDIHLEEHLLALVPMSNKEQVQAIWDRYRPTGDINVTLDYARTGGPTAGPNATPHDVGITIQPTNIEIDAAGDRVAIEHVKGSIRIDSEGIQLNDLVVDVREQGFDEPSTVSIAGMGDISSSTFDFKGVWNGSRFESALVREIFDLVDSGELETIWTDLAPNGEAETTFNFARTDADAPLDYQVTCLPTGLHCTLNDTRVTAAFDRGSTIILTPGHVELEDIKGAHGGGDFSLRGSLEHGTERFRVNLWIDYVGDVQHEQFAALMPAAASDALDKISFKDNAPTELRGSRLRISTIPLGEESFTSTVFKTTMVAGDAEFDTGVKFSGVKGPFSVSIEHESDHPALMRIEASLRRAEVLGHRLRNARAIISLNDDASRIILDEFRAEAYGGAITATADAELGEGGTYTSIVQIAGIELARFADFARLPGSTTTLDDPSLAPEPVSPPDALDGPDASASNNAGGLLDANSGRIFAHLRINGKQGDPDSRTGRGMIRVHQGDFGSFTAGLRLVQVMSLVAPVGASWNFLNLDFFLDGQMLYFEDILLESKTVMLQGGGRMSLETSEMDIDLRSRGTIAVIKDIVGAVSDQLFQIKVSGTIHKPESRLVPLPRLRR